MNTDSQDSVTITLDGNPSDTFEIPREKYKALCSLARERGESVNQIANRLLREYVEGKSL